MRCVSAIGPVTLAGYDSTATPFAERHKKGRRSLPTSDGAALRELAGTALRRGNGGRQTQPAARAAGHGHLGQGRRRRTTSWADPARRACAITAFKAPTEEERQHDFLWRIRQHVPAAGELQVFDRSHYEDVLIVRVHDLVPEEEWSQRYDQINDFESELAASGTVIIKCFLHVSYDAQRERLLARLDDPDKHWKFNAGRYRRTARAGPTTQAAYEVMLEKCNTPQAPWYVVPADSKKYRNWAVGQLVRETLSRARPAVPATRPRPGRVARAAAPAQLSDALALTISRPESVSARVVATG